MPLSTRTYFGFSPNAGVPEPMFHWLNTGVGTPGNGYHQWTSSDTSTNSSLDWVGYDSSGTEVLSAGYIFQNVSTGDETVEWWERIFLHP